MTYDKLKHPELKQLCIERNLSAIGTKVVLIKRLKNADQEFQFKYDSSYDKIDSVVTSLFVQIKISNLHYYFNSGVIYPLELEENIIYRDENRKKDIFNYFPEYIILSKYIINSFNDDEALIELDISGINLVKIDTAIFYYSGAIPISRVKSVQFRTASIIRTFISSVKTFPDYFIPEEICKVQSINIKIESVNFDKIILPPNSELNQERVFLDKFDRIMGLFSFMKNAGIFYLETDKTYHEYPETYIDVLSLLNNRITPQNGKELGLYRYILFPFDIEPVTAQRFLFRQILDTIYRNIEFNLTISTDIILNTINSELIKNDEKLELEIVLDYLNKLENHQVSFKQILLSEQIRKNLPILALIHLTRFSNKSKQHTDKQAVRNLFISNEYLFSKKTNEFLLSVLGLYYGYKKMIKNDTNLKISDLGLVNVLESQQSIKFKLNSSLEKITIETIFQFCKKSRAIDVDLSFLKIIEGKKIKKLFNNNKFEYLDKSKVILNSEITIIERVDKVQKVLDCIDNNYNDHISLKSYLLFNLMSDLEINNEILKQIIVHNKNTIDCDKIIKIIEVENLKKR